MGVEDPLINPDILVASAPVIVMAVVALAMLRPSYEAIASLSQRDSDAMALSRLPHALPIDIAAPRYDRPIPQHFDRIKNHSNQNTTPVRRWGGYFPGGY